MLWSSSLIFPNSNRQNLQKHTLKTKYTEAASLNNKWTPQMYQHESQTLQICKAILTSHAAMKLLVIQPVFICPDLRVWLTYQPKCLTWRDSSNNVLLVRGMGPGLAVVPVYSKENVGTFVPVDLNLLCLSVCLPPLSCCPPPGVCQLLNGSFSSFSLCVVSIFTPALFFFIFCLFCCSSFHQKQPFNTRHLSFQVGSEEAVLWGVTTLESMLPAGLVI